MGPKWLLSEKHGGQNTMFDPQGNLPGGQIWYFDPQIFHFATILVPICLYCLNCTKFGQFLRKCYAEAKIFMHFYHYHQASTKISTICSANTNF